SPPILPSLLCFFFHNPAASALYPLFPTRRSSDLIAPRLGNPRVSCRKHLEQAEQVLARPVPIVVTGPADGCHQPVESVLDVSGVDRKSTRLNSSHVKISYAVFCLKKKK